MGNSKLLAVTVLIAFLSMYTLWFYYLAVMNLKNARDAKTLTKVGLILGYPIFLVGYLMDVLMNVTVLSILLLELPKEWTVTSRFSRHINTPGGYRKLVATWFCNHLLNPFDPSGCHCKKDTP